MSALRFSVLIIFFPILLGACGRSDLIRIRILSPISETKKDHTIFTDTSLSTAKKITTADPKTSGGSLYFLFKSIGLGYTTVTTKIDNEILNSSSNALLLREKTTLVTNYTDLAFGIGENYTLMWGAGVLAGGKLDTTLNYGYNSGATDETVLHKNLSGHSLFLMLGHHGFGFETLLGFRTNYIKADLEDSLSTAKKKTAGLISYESSGLRFTTNQVQLGIGFTF